MRWSWLGLLSLTACAAGPVEQTRLKDGSVEVTCQLAMDECLRRVQTQCPNLRYRILSGTSETRLRDAPPYERSYHTSRVRLICSNDGAIVAHSADEPKTETAEAPPPKARSCSVGQTRVCVGAGACQGGQTCLPDGSGFGACDCGNNAAPPASRAPEQPAPAPAPEAPASVPTPTP